MILKRLSSLIIAASVVAAAGPVQSGESDRIVGTWLVEDKSSKIEIYKCGQKYCGEIAWMRPSKKHPDPSVLRDVHNPNPKKRDRKVLGSTLLWGLDYDADDQRWEDGSIYDSRSGKVYSCQVSLDKPTKLLMRGFVGIALIGQTTVWTRVQ